MAVAVPTAPPPTRRPALRAGLLCLWVFQAFFAFTYPAAAKCLPLVENRAAVFPAALPLEGTVRLSFLGHSSFLIETAEGVTAVTDYNGFIPTPMTPDVVTMNNAHDTHYTDFPDKDIKLVLRGWNPKSGMAIHDHRFRDLRIWNVPTNVREFGGVRYNGNSIFVFETADLCIAHLGHLHHVLSDVHLGELGMIDVLLVPVDGAFTMGQDLMVEVIRQIGAPVVIPMHYFDASTLRRFLLLMKGRYKIDVREEPTVVLSRLTLPYRTVLVLPGN